VRFSSRAKKIYINSMAHVGVFSGVRAWLNMEMFTKFKKKTLHPAQSETV
jgi:hypothetical protein